MKLLVFGHSGQVAQALRARASGSLTIEPLPRAQADLAQPGACAARIAQSDADAVINAAAYTAVDQAEHELALAMQINGRAPGEMAEAAAQKGIPFLHISSDYVFDGTGHSPWQETAQTGPINAYGRSKLAGEEAVCKAGGQHAILRTSWVFSETGANFVKTMLRLSQTRDALTIVGDQVGGPTAASDIAAALITMATQMCGTPALRGTYHYAGAPSVSWAGFAREIFAKAARPVTVTEIPSTEYPTPAKRPLNSRLDCAKIETDFKITPPDWGAELDRVIPLLLKEMT
ncbi:dTDP-4-dehydrorhamnose reductase [Shimia sp. R11_0]|uniref:dTDP-4-dehydrorhamnose reductase n=1 Tax=Shimia sp. R11_0 TaxID=2821096 RepID=UPI001ADA0567|nr:dTDP-4-dehydrorhamnose reductase [Shimia sp. R11_0]MBO9476120.1 dTDP-4-dehydrorhamnose reductase [Shimia sp. R11_0]